jgi:exonuclease VII large subunit
LKRGYALVRHTKGGIVKGVGNLSATESIELQLRDGRARATIDSVLKDETSD